MPIPRVTHRLPHTCLCQVWQSSLVTPMTPIYQAFCRLTNTQCNLPMGNQSRVNPDSYHLTLGLSDNMTVCFLLGNRIFGLRLGSLTPKQNVPDNVTRLLHPYTIFWTIPQVSYTQVPDFSPEGINGPLLASLNTH